MYRTMAPVQWMFAQSSWDNDEGLALGGYAYTFLKVMEKKHMMSTNDSTFEYNIEIVTGRNSDVYEMRLLYGSEVLARAGVVNGFRNIQNLVRKLKNPREKKLNPLFERRRIRRANAGHTDTTTTQDQVQVHTCNYVEVMACPGGCINGGGQISVPDLSTTNEKQWLHAVIQAYWEIPTTDVTRVGYQKDIAQYLEKFKKESGILQTRLVKTHFNRIVQSQEPNANILGARW